MNARSRRSTRRLAAALAATALVAGTAVAGAGAASATTYQYVESRTVSVPESSAGVPVYLTVQRGDEVRVRCTGSVWGGWWGTGSNGPDGWADRAPSTYPMPGTSGGRSFAALLRFTDTGSSYVSAWRHGGTSSYHVAPYAARLEMRVNDDRPGNGSGAFSCTLDRFRPVS